MSTWQERKYLKQDYQTPIEYDRWYHRKFRESVSFSGTLSNVGIKQLKEWLQYDEATSDLYRNRTPRRGEDMAAIHSIPMIEFISRFPHRLRTWITFDLGWKIDDISEITVNPVTHHVSVTRRLEKELQTQEQIFFQLSNGDWIFDCDTSKQAAVTWNTELPLQGDRTMPNVVSRANLYLWPQAMRAWIESLGSVEDISEVELENEVIPDYDQNKYRRGESRIYKLGTHRALTIHIGDKVYKQVFELRKGVWHMTTPLGRKLRVTSAWKYGSVFSRDITVRDADTGETIDGVSRVVITLDVNKGVNEAQVTYFETNESGHIVKDPDNEFEPLMKTIKVENVELDDLTAFEIMDEIRRDNPWK